MSWEETPSFNRRRMLATVGATGVTSFAGCLGFILDDDDDVEIASEVEVAVGPDREDDFNPLIAHVEVGGTVTWVWSSGNHDVTSYHEANDLPQRAPDGTTPFSGRIDSPGDELEVVFDEEGIWDVVCVRHEDVGMVMRVIAGSPDPAEQLAMEPLDIGSDPSRARIDELIEMTNEILN